MRTERVRPRADLVRVRVRVRIRVGVRVRVGVGVRVSVSGQVLTSHSPPSDGKTERSMAWVWLTPSTSSAKGDA